MLIQTLQSLFDRDLKRLKAEIEHYKNEDKIWHFEKNISNSAGNLCLHLIGNLNTYIGAQLGQTGYIRDRDLEFSAKNVPKTELLSRIDKTIRVVGETLKKMYGDALEKEFPIVVFEKKTSTGYLLVHLATHLSYHLGQINYHRRLLDVD